MRTGGLHNHVVLLRVGRISIATFGLMAALGATVAAWAASSRQIQAGMDPERYAAVLFLALPVLSIVGSRLFALALEERRPHGAPAVVRHGFAFQGGFALTVAGVVATAAVYRLDLLLLMDTFVLGVPLGHTLGRIGCYTYGCCHGRKTDSVLSVRYTNPESKAVWQSGLGGVDLHPTQLYSAAGNLLLFLLLSRLANEELRPGELSSLYLLMSSTGRFGIELLRGVPARRWRGLSAFQWVSVLGLIVGAALWFTAPHGTRRLLFGAVGWLDAVSRAAGDMGSYLGSLFVLFLLVFGVHGARVGQATGSGSP